MSPQRRSISWVLGSLGLLALALLYARRPAVPSALWISIQNDTASTLWIKAMGRTRQLPPGERLTLAKLPCSSGSKGIQPGLWQQQLWMGDHKLVLRQRRAKGRCRLSHALGDSAWHATTALQHFAWPVGKRSWTLSSRYIQKGGLFSLRYHLQEERTILPTAPDRITVLVYNVFMRPPLLWLFRDGQRTRARLIPPRLQGADVVVLAEAFDARSRQLLHQGLKQAYPHHTKLLGQDRRLKKNGGVWVLSRWPIERQAQIVYKACKGTDCLAQKGAIYARVAKPGRPFHLFATHAQAHPGRRAQEVRSQQFRALARWIKRAALPPREPVLIAGDLNVDRRNHPVEFQAMLSILGAACPTLRGAHYTYHPQYNGLAQGKRPEYLDYVLWLKAHLQPQRASLTPWAFQSRQPWRKHTWALSDHSAVIGHLSFSKKP